MAGLCDMTTRRVHAIRGASVTIGRHVDCDLQVQEQRVSGRHARITLSDGVYHLADLGSSNGTEINGKRITEKIQLKQGDIISFAGRAFEFVEHSSASSKSIPPAFGLNEPSVDSGKHAVLQQVEIDTEARPEVSPEAKLRA